MNRTLKLNPSFVDRRAQQLIVRALGRLQDDPELDHDAYLDKQG
ncbi:hypothetical protein LAUMK13_04583 [Mycobacterium innocens]|uniref:Uncharacterized protein n=1 Tax=Mycobacterium innocens TaxID=2341083 RepID=A0A498QB94_9MYCO|nr:MULTISPECIES: hypothetical protein [Mycobacterium]VBA43548.1 hypothetical protein LAUMK13_04583 [Mycobacterium innocens]